MSSQNRQTSRRWFEEVWNARNAESACEMMAQDAVGHTETGKTVGLEEFLALRDRFLDAIPDLKFDVESVVADGDESAIRWVARGTHSGDALGVPACHKPVEVRGMTWHRFEDGVMVEGWDAWNIGGLMQHLTAEPGADHREADAEPEEDEDEPDDEPGSSRRLRPAELSKSRYARRVNTATRLRDVRVELYGEHGGPALARALGLPARTWYNYETGVTIPAEILLEFAELTGVQLRWLLSGEGPRYEDGRGPASGGGS